MVRWIPERLQRPISKHVCLCLERRFAQELIGVQHPEYTPVLVLEETEPGHLPGSHPCSVVVRCRRVTAVPECDASEERQPVSRVRQ